ncbi:hypothetical protein B0A50_08029 [Salinomyces thailandicus]|uniref:dipeptidyl-peptidase IV n=1 Tax=Salinomyces thailandicus TaxID=706561 RepID=A0A4U0TKD3_9PEZI|nr:hypothetical protein B0A50_08029 [Salinomyces thailandica]
MARTVFLAEESRPLTSAHDRRSPPVVDTDDNGLQSRASASSASTSSLAFEHLSDKEAREALYRDHDPLRRPEEELDIEEALAWKRQTKPVDKKARRVFYVLIAVGVLGWVTAFFLFLSQDRHVSHSQRPHDPHATSTVGSGKKVTLEQVLTGEWYARHHAIRWVEGPNGEDGLLLEQGGEGDFLVVDDVRFRDADAATQKEHRRTLMRSGQFEAWGETVRVTEAWPSPDQTKVLVQSNYTSNWRHSGTAQYWIFDVEKQTGEPLDQSSLDGRIQVASWSPSSDAVVFTRDNDMFIRHFDSGAATRITEDGGPELFNGVPDWVYEEEVLAGDSATWWSGDGEFLAFFRTNESKVPSFPVQYYFSSPTGMQKKAGEENYPETREIKYPKAGAPMSVVSLQLYDVQKGQVFSVPIEDDFTDDNRLITEVVWAGESGKVLIRSTNRESDVLKTILIDAKLRTGRTVRERDVQKLDGGWFEVSETTTFVPADPGNGRAEDGYIDMVIHDNWDHLAYFTPLQNPEPIMLTEGKWEVVKAPSSVDLKNNLVYFVATKDGSTQRHVYTVDLHKGPKSINAVTDTSEIGYYEPSFSTGSQYMLLTYHGPHIPWQKVVSTPSAEQKMSISIEENKELEALAKKTELPIEVHQTITIDGFEMNLVERRPPHFDPKKKYPVLFYLYNGPGFQHVNRKFNVDFQSFVASSLGYIVVTLDARGTGYMGRRHRCIIRGNIGYWEAHDQIAAAKMWAAKKYVDADRLAIWGWSYGGFMTLKTLEADAGETFKYGMAVAPVTDWRFYDSIYTERYMHTPQHNPEGYANASISNMTSLARNTRFLVMHGASDDNVHFQNTLSLLDKLDLANVRSYDVHIFPDSDHSIFFHNGNRVVYEKLRDWLVAAFEGRWAGLGEVGMGGVV